MPLDPDEKPIHCAECNSYLWSTFQGDRTADLIPCPYQKDPCGQCTGIPKNIKPKGTQ